jgi:hypothetical protein
VCVCVLGFGVCWVCVSSLDVNYTPTPTYLLPPHPDRQADLRDGLDVAAPLLGALRLVLPQAPQEGGVGLIDMMVENRVCVDGLAWGLGFIYRERICVWRDRMRGWVGGWGESYFAQAPQEDGVGLMEGR